MSDLVIKNHSKQHVGVQIRADGDHQLHTIDLREDVDVLWDGDSLVLTIAIDEYHAKELFWELLEVIPKLRKDRR